MARFVVGLPHLQGKLSNYAERYDLVELRPGDTPLPSPPKLRRWREQVPPSFVFSVVLPKAVAEFSKDPEIERGIDDCLEAAVALQARCIVLATPPSIRPTAANRQRVVSLGARLPQTGHVLAWEPWGMWEREDVLETAYEAGFLPVFDGVRETLPAGPIAYTRIRALGSSAQLGTGSIERLADQLQGRREAFVVVEAPAAKRVRVELGPALERLQTRPAVPMLFRGGQPKSLAAEDEEQ